MRPFRNMFGSQRCSINAADIHQPCRLGRRYPAGRASGQWFSVGYLRSHYLSDTTVGAGSSVVKIVAWHFWLPNPLFPFIWFKVALPGKHRELLFDEIAV